MYRLAQAMLLLLALAACGTAPSPVSSDEVNYYTTEGVEPLSWKLDIYTPDKSSLRASYTDSSPGGIVAGFQWSVRGDGAPLQMRWQAVPTEVDIQPRDVVQLTVDGQPAFFGVVTRTWPDDEPDVREYIALGGIELLRYRSHVDPASYPEQDVAAIARQVISTYKHPAITYDAALIPDLGDTISMPSVYRLELGQILDTLARTVSSKGVTWGVDAQGRAFFGVPSGSVQVGYEESDLRWQPEAGDEVVTRVDLVLATQGEPNTVAGDGSYDVSAGYTPKPIVWSAAHADDALYGVQRTYVAAGLLTTIEGGSVDSSTYCIANPSNALDGDPSTYASSSCTNRSAILVVTPPAGAYVVGVEVGFYLQHPANADTQFLVSFDYLNSPPGRRYVRKRYQQTTGSTARMLVLPPLELAGTPIVKASFGVGVESGGDGVVDIDELKIFDVRWIVVDQRCATEYAESLLKPPVQKPASASWQRYRPPVPVVTIAGAPGGDLTHQVREWRYTWAPERIETVAMLGDAADDELTLAISRVAAVNQAAALSTARALTEPK